MKYKDFKTEHFINDAFFRQWVFTPNKKTDHFWSEWVKDNPGKKEAIDQARTILEGQRASRMPGHFSSIRKDKLWNKIQDTIEKEEKADPANVEGEDKKVIPLYGKYSEVSRKTTAYPRRSRYRAVAVVSILIMAVLAALFFHEKTPTVLNTSVALVTKENPRGQKSRVYLPDGTNVTLNANSKISYPIDFAADVREVYLQGEAFFEVTKNAVKPFIVYSDNVMTKVLGTSFNIKCDKNEEIKVSLVTGKVEVRHDDDNAVVEYLIPGQQYAFHRETKAVRTLRFNPQEVLAWKDGIIIFRNAPKAEVFDRLSTWYGVDFEFENEPQNSKEWKYSARYEQISLEQVLKGMSYSKDFSYRIEGRIVHVKYHEP